MNRKKMIEEYVVIHIGCGLAFLSMFVYMLLQKAGLFPKMPCIFLEFTHLYCPGCGGTRALFALISGHVVRSLKFNPAVLLGIFLVIYYEIGAIRTIIKNDGKCYYEKKGIPLYVYLVVVMCFAILRDVMLAGFGIDESVI